VDEIGAEARGESVGGDEGPSRSQRELPAGLERYGEKGAGTDETGQSALRTTAEEELAMESALLGRVLEPARPG
jgi:hypothetical protein